MGLAFRGTLIFSGCDDALASIDGGGAVCACRCFLEQPLIAVITNNPNGNNDRDRPSSSMASDYVMRKDAGQCALPKAHLDVQHGSLRFPRLRHSLDSSTWPKAVSFCARKQDVSRPITFRAVGKRYANAHQLAPASGDQRREMEDRDARLG